MVIANPEDVIEIMGFKTPYHKLRQVETCLNLFEIQEIAALIIPQTPT